MKGREEGKEEEMREQRKGLCRVFQSMKFDGLDLESFNF
jgi:hypothetical protein